MTARGLNAATHTSAACYCSVRSKYYAYLLSDGGTCLLHPGGLHATSSSLGVMPRSPKRLSLSKNSRQSLPECLLEPPRILSRRPQHGQRTRQQHQGRGVAPLEEACQHNRNGWEEDDIIAGLMYCAPVVRSCSAEGCIYSAMPATCFAQQICSVKELKTGTPDKPQNYVCQHVLHVQSTF